MVKSIGENRKSKNGRIFILINKIEFTNNV